MVAALAVSLTLGSQNTSETLRCSFHPHLPLMSCQNKFTKDIIKLLASS